MQKSLKDLDGIFGRANALLEELGAAQDSNLTKKERSKAARNVRGYVRQFKDAGLTVRFYDGDCQPITLGKGTAAYLMVHEKSRPSVAQAAAIVRAGGSLDLSPLAGAFVTWPVEEPMGPEDALAQAARAMLDEPRKPKPLPALPAGTTKS